jgi:hypothetical protein
LNGGVAQFTAYAARTRVSRFDDEIVECSQQRAEFVRGNPSLFADSQSAGRAAARLRRSPWPSGDARQEASRMSTTKTSVSVPLMPAWLLPVLP